MIGLLDTSVIVRYLTDDPPKMAERAAKILDQDHTLGLTDVIIAESAYVLSNVYGVERAVVVDTMTELLQKRNIETVGVSKPLVLRALQFCRPSKRVAFADALLWAQARHNRVWRVFTFDKRFPAQEVELTP